MSRDETDLKYVERFVRQALRLYLEERELGKLQKMLHRDITWFDTEDAGVYRGLPEIAGMLEKEKRGGRDAGRVHGFWIGPVHAGDGFYTVLGGYKLLKAAEEAIETRFTITCVRQDEQMLLYHVHFSQCGGAGGGPEDRAEACDGALVEKAGALEKLANSIAGGLQICDLDGDYTIRFVSHGFLKLVGYTREELLGSSHIRLVHPADAGLLSGQIAHQLKTDGAFSVVYRIVQKGGGIRWVLDNGSLFGAAGDKRQVQCFLTDITEQKLQEEELRVSKKRYEVALQQLDVSMFEYNIATRQLFLYEREASLYGVATVIEDGPKVLAESGYFNSECVPGYLEMYRKICSGEETVAKCQVTAHDIDGNFHEFELTLTAVLDQSGLPIRAIGVKKHVSHLRKLQRELEFSKTMEGERRFICEADITNDRILRVESVLGALPGGLDTSESYSQVMERAAGHYVTREQQAGLKEKFNRKRLEKAFERGCRTDRCAFQAADDGLWYEATVNIIRDETSGNVCIRVYYEDISARKQEESQTAERRLYEAAAARARIAYEVNISRDTAISGHENWGGLYGIETNGCYSEMLEAFSRRGMDPRDSARFLDTFSRERVLEAYYGGERELSCQYRRNGREGVSWVETTLHLFENPDNGEICGYTYVENIDRQKRAELDLRYKAEHDSHTGLFNKQTTAERIGQFLESPQGKSGSHAFLMVDLDRFKEINDCFGHLFGDGVIAEMARRIRAVFRDDDIVGRIGGDEFCIFMKGVVSQASVVERGERLCRALTERYGDDECAHTLSASVGIALYPNQGRNFEELYRRADSALYAAKCGGRGRCATAK